MKKDYEQRFCFIEVMIIWQGRINATHLLKHFSLSRQSASKTFSRYLALHPQAITYSEQHKGFIATTTFTPHFANGDFRQYQELVNHSSDLSFSAIVDIALPTRNPSPLLAQPILRAIDNHLAIDIGYTSLTSPQYLDRIIEPHCLIFDGLRWHVRAFCHKNNMFRDFVLSRFNGAVVDEGHAQQDPLQDQLWHTQVTLSIQPDPRLSPLQQQVIIDDYQMQNGLLTIETRAALVNYVLKRLHLDNYQMDPCAQQIVLTTECEQAVRKYRY